MAETIQGFIDPFGRWNSQVSVDTFLKLPDRGLIGDSIELSFDLRFSCLSRAVIERYVELSTDELSIPIIPYTEDLWHKLINPQSATVGKEIICVWGFHSDHCLMWAGRGNVGVIDVRGLRTIQLW